MRNQPLPLPLGFYASEDRPFSQQDVWNYLPCKAEAPGARSSLMLKTPPGLYPWAEVAGAPPVRGIHDCEGKLFAVIGTTLYRLSPTGVAIPYGTIPGNGRVSMDHNQRARGQQLTIVNGAAGYVLDTVGYDLQRITDAGFPGSPVIRFLDGFMVGIDPAGRFAFNSDAANATEYNTLNRWTSEYRPDRLVSMGRLGGELLLLSANSGEFFGNTGAAQQPFRSKRIFIDKGCAGPHTVVEADNTVFWLGSDGHFYQLDGYNPRRISTRPIEQAIRGQDGWNAFGFVWESEGHTVVYWTFLNGQTWGWDTSQQQWHRRESYGLDRWRVSCTARSAGQWYAGDFQRGRLWRIDWGYPWEGDTEFASGFTVPVIHDNQNELIHSRLELVMDTGMPAVEPAQFPVQPAGPMISGSAPDGVIGEPYAFAYTVTQGDAQVVRTIIDRAALLPGLSWDEATATISGTPAAYGDTPISGATVSIAPRVVDLNGLSAQIADEISFSHEQATWSTPDELASTTHLAVLPPDVKPGDLLIFISVLAKNSALDAGGGAVSLGFRTIGGVTALSVHYRIADGSEGTSLTFTSPSAASACGIVYRYRLGAYSGTPECLFDPPANNQYDSQNPPLLAPSWGAADCYWMAAACARFVTRVNQWSLPLARAFASTYPQSPSIGAGTVMSRQICASIQREAADSFNPSAYVIDSSTPSSQTLSPVAVTIALRAAP